MALAALRGRRQTTGLRAICVGVELRRETIGYTPQDVDFNNAPANITRLDKQLFTLPSPGAIAAGRAVEVSVTVSDAQPGDTIVITPPATLETGLLVSTAYVPTDDTIHFRIFNSTVSPITPADQDLTYCYFLVRSQVDVPYTQGATWASETDEWQTHTGSWAGA